MQPTGWKSCSRSLRAAALAWALQVRKTKADVVLRSMLGFVGLSRHRLQQAVVLGQTLNPQLQGTAKARNIGACEVFVRTCTRNKQLTFDPQRCFYKYPMSRGRRLSHWRPRSQGFGLNVADVHCAAKVVVIRRVPVFTMAVMILTLVRQDQQHHHFIFLIF